MGKLYGSFLRTYIYYTFALIDSLTITNFFFFDEQRGSRSGCNFLTRTNKVGRQLINVSECKGLEPLFDNFFGLHISIYHFYLRNVSDNLFHGHRFKD